MYDEAGLSLGRDLVSRVLQIWWKVRPQIAQSAKFLKKLICFSQCHAASQRSTLIEEGDLIIYELAVVLGTLYQELSYLDICLTWITDNCAEERRTNCET